MSAAPPATALWPARLVAAAKALRESLPPCREHSRAALWSVLHAALYASLRSQAGRIPGASVEDLEDLASQKSLDLLLRAENGMWDPCGRADHEVGGYIARVARHALVDLARQRGRECPAPDDSEGWAIAFANRVDDSAGPEDQYAAREFGGALRECAERLAPRARQAWFRRVYLEYPSCEIAALLGLRAAHVDVVVQRARAALRTCMTAKGHDDRELAPGAFASLWRWFATEAEEIEDAR